MNKDDNLSLIEEYSSFLEISADTLTINTIIFDDRGKYIIIDNNDDIIDDDDDDDDDDLIFFDLIK